MSVFVVRHLRARCAQTGLRAEMLCQQPLESLMVRNALRVAVTLITVRDPARTQPRDVRGADQRGTRLRGLIPFRIHRDKKGRR